MLYGLLRNQRSSDLKKSVFLIALLLGSLGIGQIHAQSKEESPFKARLINLEGSVSDPFRFQTTLKNTSAESKIYELQAELPEGWRASFSVMGSRVTAVKVEPSLEQEISFEVFPSASAEPGKYDITLKAVAPSETHALKLQADITGSYDLELTTPDGRVSNEVISGSTKQFTLTIKNSGTLPLKELELSAQLPSKWEASFDPKEIEQVEPGSSKEIQVNLDVPEKMIAGDYIAKFTVKNADKEAEVSYRLTVKTSILSGWLGILVIVLALGLVYYLIRKYGRR